MREDQIVFVVFLLFVFVATLIEVAINKSQTKAGGGQDGNN